MGILGVNAGSCGLNVYRKRLNTLKDFSSSLKGVI